MDVVYDFLFHILKIIFYLIHRVIFQKNIRESRTFDEMRKAKLMRIAKVFDKNITASGGESIIFNNNSVKANVMEESLENTANIVSIGSPQSGDRGRASAIHHISDTDISDTDISERQQHLLRQLPTNESEARVRKKDVSMNDLAAMTAKTDDEFMMFTCGSERIIVRGKGNIVQIDEERLIDLNARGYKWTGHTHPDMTTYPSDEDFEVLSYFNQESSLIYNIVGDHEQFFQKER